MSRVFFLLCIFSLFLFAYPAILLAQEPLAAPSTPNPASGAPFVTLPLILNWEDVLEAQSYRYELMGYEEDGAPKEFFVTQSQSGSLSPAVIKFLEPQHPAQWYKENCDKNGDGTPDECTDADIRTFIKKQQRQFWHVKSCEDSGGTKCGPWGAVWDFTYLPPPAVLKTPIANAINVPLPVTLDWGDMPGAKSYDLILLPCPPWMTPKPDDPCYSIPIHLQGATLLSEYEDDVCSFMKGLEYGWGIASCLDEQSSFCTDPKDFPLWSFRISTNLPSFNPPLPLKPLVKDDPPKTPDPAENVPSVSKNIMLEWSMDGCAYFFRVNVFNDAGVRITNDTCEVSGSTCTKEVEDKTFILGDIKSLWDQAEDLDKTYSWSVTPCWGRAGPGILVADCPPAADTGADSEKWYFHTEGKPPTLVAPGNNTSTKIPIVLSWQGDGASFRYELSKDGTVKPGPDGSFATPTKPQPELAKTTNAQLGYEKDIMEPSKDYWWHVKTCVDEKGDVCGPWSGELSRTFKFSTFALLIPDTPNPPDGGIIQLDQSVSWKSVDAANAYAYHLEYACRDEKENKEECTAYGIKVCPDTSAMKTIEDNKITARNSFELPYCMGRYEWKALTCLQDKCQDPPETRTTWSNGGTAWKLTAVQPPSVGAGLVPCARFSNDDATPYDETEKCKLKHLGFLLQNLLDFILWKVSLFTLLVLAVITGATSYFSLGGPNALARIKTVFRSFFAGFIILMFAWMFVNIILMLFGFQFEFFGKWWEISF